MDSSNQTKDDMTRELTELTELADAGEAAGVFLHELGNVLNNLLLDAKLMQRELSDEHRDRFDVSCRIITEAAEQMQVLARYRQHCRCQPYAIDLNDVVRQVAMETEKLEFKASRDTATIHSTLSDAKRLVRLLLRNAVAVSHDKKNPVAAHVSSSKKKVQLTVDVPGVRMRESDLNSLFEPFQSVFPSWNNLEAAMARNLTRRSNGTINAEKSKEGGLVFTLTWPVKRVDHAGVENV